MLAAAVVAVWQFARTEAVSRDVRRAEETSRAIVRVHLDVSALRERVAVMADTRETAGFVRDSESLRQTFFKDVETARQLLIASSLKVALPSELDTVVNLANAGDWTAVRFRLSGRIQDLLDLIYSQVQRVDQQVLRAQSEALEKRSQSRRQLFVAASTAALLALLAAAALGWFLTQSITVPLNELASAADALARRDFQHEVQVTGNDELAVVGRAFNHAARQLSRQFAITLEARVAERTRIARELHDTLLQSFHAVLLRFQTVAFLLPEHSEAQQKLENAIEQAARAITEGRDAVQGLRESTVQMNDLARTLKSIGEELQGNSTSEQSPSFRVLVEGQSRELHPIIRDEIYKVAAEALRNAFRHSEARNIEAEIRYDDEQVGLRVSDDGKGMAPALLSGPGREGHFGLAGMKERAVVAGGSLSVRSELGAGTHVELTIPANIAYETLVAR